MKHLINTNKGKTLLEIETNSSDLTSWVSIRHAIDVYFFIPLEKKGAFKDALEEVEDLRSHYFEIVNRMEQVGHQLNSWHRFVTILQNDGSYITIQINYERIQKSK